MGENKLRIGTETATIKPNGNGKSVFSGLEKKLKLETYFEEGFPVQNIPKIVFVMFLCLFYIGNTHYAEKTVRKISHVRAEVEDLRADYTTMKADLMYASKQSEVARKVSQFGLEESLEPPHKITIEKGEY